MSSNEEQIIFEPQAKRISIKGLIYLALKESEGRERECVCVIERGRLFQCTQMRECVCERERVSEKESE